MPSSLLLPAMFRALPRWLLACCLLLAVALAPFSASRADDTFLDPEDAFRLTAAMATPTELLVQFTIAPDYYMYRQQFAFDLSPQPQWLGMPDLPPGKVKYDPTFDQDMEIHVEQVQIRLPLQPGASQPLTLAITSQGCAEAGLCYSPMTSELQLLPTVSGYDVSGPGAGPLERLGGGMSVAAAGGLSQARGGTGDGAGIAGVLAFGDLAMADYLAQSGVLNIVLVCLLLGLLLSFTPCVLPMVPILLTVIAGTSGRPDHGGDASGAAASSQAHGAAPSTGPGAASQARPSRRHGLVLALLYVLGMSLVYTALGIGAGLLGASLAVWLQSPWLLGLFALLLALLALAMFDVFTFQAPAALQSALSARMSRIPGGRHGGAFVMGMLSALIVGPCVAAPLAGVLLFISQTGDVLLGGAALFALAWGQGLLLLVVGASSGALLPRAGAWMERVKHVFGVLLLATAWWMLVPVLPSTLLALGWALLAFWAAILFGALRPMPASPGPWRMLGCAAGYLLALWGAAILLGVAAGGRDALRPLAVFGATQGAAVVAQAGAPAAGALAAAGVSHPPFARIRSEAELDAVLAEGGKPVMLDFYADWCVSCIEMERYTFSDPTVAARMSDFRLLQVDVTGNTADDRALLKRFRLFGPPGIVFHDAQGRLLPEVRVVGFQDAPRFLKSLDAALAGG